jgi:hypothetical protein
MPLVNDVTMPCFAWGRDEMGGRGIIADDGRPNCVAYDRFGGSGASDEPALDAVDPPGFFMNNPIMVVVVVVAEGGLVVCTR